MVVVQERLELRRGLSDRLEQARGGREASAFGAPLVGPRRIRPGHEEQGSEQREQEVEPGVFGHASGG